MIFDRNLSFRLPLRTIVVIILFTTNVNLSVGKTVADSWILFAREAKNIFQLCPKNDTVFQVSWPCLKAASLDLFDNITASDVIPLTSKIRMMRYRANTINDWEKSDKNDFMKRDYRSFEIDASIWSSHILKRFLGILSTHVVQVDLEGVSKDSARARHRRNQMLPMMAFGMTALGMVMVPLGFQFLAVLGGKALLLAKMALVLASINGFKRVATSGVHYGLYHTDPHYNHGPWERSDHSYSHPRNLQTDIRRK